MTDPRQGKWVAKVTEEVPSRDDKKTKSTLPLQGCPSARLLNWPIGPQPLALLGLVVGILRSCSRPCACPGKLVSGGGSPRSCCSSLPVGGLGRHFPQLHPDHHQLRVVAWSEAWAEPAQTQFYLCPLITNSAPFQTQRCQVCTINHMITSPEVNLAEFHPVWETPVWFQLSVQLTWKKIHLKI